MAKLTGFGAIRCPFRAKRGRAHSSGFPSSPAHDSLALLRPAVARGLSISSPHEQQQQQPGEYRGEQQANRSQRATPPSEMGSFFSTMFTPPPAGDDLDSAVVAAHSKATYDEQWEAHKSSGKLVGSPSLPAPLSFWFSSPRFSAGLLVIDFSASWCGPCRFIEPAFKEMSSRYTDVIFVKIDVDELAVRDSDSVFVLLVCLFVASEANSAAAM
ncbi:hypothetical protein HU200_029825 [Digitaria exilis]|uniref:Thioredoxin domain-containing protein n=1 Tax=Digitaria exilis TaxID=1010633 RepID=A0A835BU50_9POAL|nr:hypothetical protein HU200_029825 [Digitaria exilis]